MELAVHLQPRDLASIRFSISPIAHLLLAAQQPQPYPAALRWWRRVRGQVPAAAAPLLELLNAKPGYIPDFLLPPIAVDGRGLAPTLADELDAVCAATAEQIDDELRLYDALPRPPRVIEALRDGGRAVDRLADGVHALYRSCLADDWPDIERGLRTDLAMRADRLTGGGVGAMLDTLGPWHSDSSSLVITGSCTRRGRRKAVMDGRGLLLSANRFLEATWTASIGPWQLPVLTYPAVKHTGPLPAPRSKDTLTVLIGRGRAATLRAVGTGCTTGELATRLAVSAPTASVQARALREAGLLQTVRDGKKVVHTVTTLGAGLLWANPAREGYQEG